VNPFVALVNNLNSLGFFGFLLPFIFVFVVLYAILLKTKILGDNQRIIGVLSLVVAFFVIGYGGTGLANFFVNFFGLATILIAGLLVLMLFIGLAGWDLSNIANKNVVAAILAAIVIIIFFTAAGSIGVRISDSVIGIIFIIIILAVAIGFVTKG